MNNKGQTLVAFILLLPIIFILLCLVLDLGMLNAEKRKIQNTVKQIITDTLKENKNSDESKQRITNLLNKNIKDVTNYKIDVSNNMVIITVTKEQKSILPILKNKYEIKVSYKGYKVNNKITIKKE